MVMTWMQRRFVAEYLTDFNARQAAIRAGYSGKNTAVGVTLLNTPLVDAEIRRQCLKIQVRLEITGDDVRRGFARIATDPRQESEGGPSYMARIKALRELGLLMGLYKNEIHIKGEFTLVDLLLAADASSLAVPAPLPAARPALEHSSH